MLKNLVQSNQPCLMVFVFLAFSGSSLVTAQNSVLLERDCDSPYLPPEGSGWTAVEFSTDVEWMTDPVVTHDVRKGSWIGEDACNCHYVPCDMRNHPCVPQSQGHHVSNEICWGVGGSITVEGKTALLARLFLELGVSVTVNANFQHCHVWGESFTFTVQMSDCFRNFARATWIESTATGQMLHAESITVLRKEGEPDRQHLCGLSVRANADVNMKGDRDIQRPPYPERYGGPSLPEPDRYDGKRAMPCCHLLAPWDEVPPESHTCCACYAPG